MSYHRYSGPYPTQMAAERQSQAAMRRLCRERGLPYPLPPGPSTGGRPLADPSVAYATHAVTWRQQPSTRQWWCTLTDELQALLPGPPEEVPGGAPVTVAHTGIDKPDTDFEGNGNGRQNRNPNIV